MPERLASCLVLGNAVHVDEASIESHCLNVQRVVQCGLAGVTRLSKMPPPN